jgi:hypothetical protein
LTQQREVLGDLLRRAGVEFAFEMVGGTPTRYSFSQGSDLLYVYPQHRNRGVLPSLAGAMGEMLLGASGGEPIKPVDSDQAKPHANIEKLFDEAIRLGREYGTNGPRCTPEQLHAKRQEFVAGLRAYGDAMKGNAS